jgi:hypothetical protein
MNPRRPHAQIHLPPLSAEYAITLVDIFERAITAIWHVHGDSMSNLQALRGEKPKRRDVIPSGDPNAPDSDF